MLPNTSSLIDTLLKQRTMMTPKAGFYTPFFVKYPEFIFSKGLHVIQFSALKPVKPDPGAPDKKNTG